MSGNSNQNRIRVLDFEKEAEERLSSLGQTEQDILSVGKLRQRWLSSVNNMDEVETDTFGLQLENMRANLELAELNLSIDQIQMEELYEQQTLNYLVQATKPLENGESKESRAEILEQMTKENLDELCGALRTSIDFRSKINKKMRDSTVELAKLRVNHDNRHSVAVSDLQDRMAQYAERMKEAVLASKKQHKKITGEYLVLRHNARVAKEVLQRSQNEAQLGRKLLQEKLEKLTEEAAGQRERMEAAALAELKIMTEDIRNNVIRKENEVNDVRRHIELLKSSQKQSNRDLRKAVKVYDTKRLNLEKRRKSEITVIKEELQGLRNMCTSLENIIDAQRMKDQVPSLEEFPLSSLKDLTIFHELEHVAETYHLKRK